MTKTKPEFVNCKLSATVLTETLKKALQGYNDLCMNINPHFTGSNCIYLKVHLCMPLHPYELVPVNGHSICVSMCA